MSLLAVGKRNVSLSLDWGQSPSVSSPYRLPQELWVKIFFLLKKQKAFGALSFVDKTLYTISRDPSLLVRFVPTFLSRSRSKDIVSLDLLRKIKMGHLVEKNLKQGGPYQKVVTLCTPVASSRYLACSRIVGDYLVVCYFPEYPFTGRGTLFVKQLSTKNEYLFRAHQENITAMEWKDPFLITGSTNSKKSLQKILAIWDFTHCLTEKNPSPMLFTEKSKMGVTCLKVHEEFLIVGYSDHTLEIWNLKKKKKEGIFFQSQNPLDQIGPPFTDLLFSKQKLIVASLSQVIIWDFSHIKKMIEKNQELLSIQPLKRITMKEREIAHLKIIKNRLVVIWKKGYKKNKNHVIGITSELVSTRKNKRIYCVSPSPNFFNIEGIDHLMFCRAQGLLGIWDFKKETVYPYLGRSTVRKINMLNDLCLIETVHSLEIWDNRLRHNIRVLNSKLLEVKKEEDEKRSVPEILSVRLDANFLIVETERNGFYYNRKIVVFDISKLKEDL